LDLKINNIKYQFANYLNWSPVLVGFE